MFTTDRDLLILEPNLFRDVLWLSQRRVTGTGVISSGAVMFTTSDNRLSTAGVGPGSVVVVGATPYEVMEVTSDTDAVISLIRASASGDIVPPGDSPTDTTATISTFVPQIGIVQSQVLRMLGIEPGQATTPGHPGEDAITNPGSLTRFIALGALHLIYSSAGVLTPADSPLNQRADLYRLRFSRERERVTIGIDLNNDGLPDATRKLNMIQFVRS